MHDYNIIILLFGCTEILRQRGGFPKIEEGVETGNKKKGTHKIVRKKYNYEHYCDLYYAALGKLGIRRLTPHKARHTFFTMLSDNAPTEKA